MSSAGSRTSDVAMNRPITIMSAAAGSLALDAQNPWPGLASYDEASSAFFHGREADAAELVRLIKLSPFVTFYGKSGLGKSSVLQAGVFPVLREAHFLPVHLRLDYAAQTPLMEQASLRLRQEIDASGADAPEREPGETLWAYLQRRDTPIWGADNFPLTPVLVFDQFEEVFSLGGSVAHVQRLLEEMADFAADRLPHELTDDRDVVRRLNLQTQQYHVVLAFRSDFLAEVAGWVKRSNLPRHESLHLMPMPRDNAVKAVARVGAAVLEPGVAEQIVDFLLQREVKGDGAGPVGGAQPQVQAEQSSGPALVSPLGGDVEPALLSLCCYQLNRNRKRKGLVKIDAELLRTFGASILADFYQEAVKNMPPRVPRFIEENLILGDRYRNPYPREVAISSGGLTEDELHQLTKNRLLRIDPQGDELRIELIHDRLVGVVRESRDARRAHEAQEAERAAVQKQQREALEKLERERAAAETKQREALEKLEREREAAEQRIQLERERERAQAAERERARVARWRNGLMVAATAMVFAIAGLVVQSMRASRANAELADIVETLTDTRNSLNDNLKAAKEDGEEARKELAEVKTRMATLELDLAKLDAAKNVAAPAVAAARVRDAEEQVQQQAAKVQAYEASRQSVGRQPTYTVQGWRLASNGCGKGAVSVSGQATFIVTSGGNTVEIREVFNGQGDGFKVSIDTKASLPAKNPGCYELPTVGNWSSADRRFKTQGVDRVCVNGDGAPVSATISRIRTDCGY